MEHIVPAISVIIPLYNKEAIIEQSVRSVLFQSFTDFELIIVNDGSTDRSSEIVCGIKDERIRFIEQENAGPSAARNKGAQNAKADWIVFLDADDELLPGALEHFYDISVEYKDIDFFCCNYYLSNKHKRRLAYLHNSAFVKNNFKAHVLGLVISRTGSSMYSKHLVLECLFNESIRRFEDLDSILRMYKKSRVLMNPSPVLVVNTEFATASKSRKNISEDFVGHIDISNKSFWEKLAYYKLFFEEHAHYPKQSRELYPHLYKRYDLYLICVLLGKIGKYRMLNKLFLSIVGNPIKEIK